MTMKLKLSVKEDSNRLSVALGWLLKEWKKLVEKPLSPNESLTISKNWELSAQDLSGISL
jgi:hypothetical protein